jgi:arsenate reductase-like glutaredoxin family protein
MENIILTEEDKEIIDSLKVSPILKLANIARNYTIEDVLSIEDLNIEKLKELLPKIDLYVDEIIKTNSEIYKETGDLSMIDEAWLLDYSALKQSIQEKINLS